MTAYAINTFRLRLCGLSVSHDRGALGAHGSLPVVKAQSGGDEQDISSRSAPAVYYATRQCNMGGLSANRRMPLCYKVCTMTRI